MSTDDADSRFEVGGIDFTPTGDRIQLGAFGFMMAFIGFWFGSNITGRFATQAAAKQATSSGSGALPLTEAASAKTVQIPEWVHTVQTMQHAVLALAAVCLIVVLALDYKLAA